MAVVEVVELALAGDQVGVVTMIGLWVCKRVA